MVNFEILPGQSSVSFLEALEIMEARYGVLTEINSDAGSNFIPLVNYGADHEEEVGEVFSETPASQGTVFSDSLIELKKQGRYRVNIAPPSCPWWQGVAESIINTVKRILHMKEQKQLHVIGWLHLIKSIQTTINQRPISYKNNKVILTRNNLLGIRRELLMEISQHDHPN